MPMSTLPHLQLTSASDRLGRLGHKRTITSLRAALTTAFALAASGLVEPLVAATRPGAATKPTAPIVDLETLRVPYEKIVLDNGLTVLVHTDHSTPIVAVNTWYHVGSRDERAGRTGFAHLFEHFFFNGSEHYPHGFREAMDDLGANNRNGTTNTDRTNFFEDVPTSALERTLYLEADRLGFLAGNLSAEMLERERGVVQNEKRQGENQPYGRVAPRILEAIFPAAHPYSWSTIGRMEDLDAATLDDVAEWYRTYYGPNNCVLALAGDITALQARELVTRYFAGIPPGPPLPRHGAWVPRLDREQRATMEDRVPQARVYRVWPVAEWSHADLRQLQLLAGVLSGSRSSRLDRRLVYEKELATAVGTFVDDGEMASTFWVVATVKPGVDPAVVEREIDAVLRETLAKGPTVDELDRTRGRTFAQLARGIERLGGFGGRSDVLAESMTFGGDPHAYLGHLEQLTAATPSSVAAAGRSWLELPSYTLTVLPYPRLSPGTTTVDRSVLPAVGEPPAPRFPAVQRARLANGLELVLLERHTAPLVQLALVVDAGTASDRPESAGLASFALGLLDDGTTTRDTFEISDELDRLGARLTTDSSLDLSFVRLRALRSTLAPALDLFADVVRNPAFPGDLVALEQRRRLAQIEQEKAQPVGIAFRLAPGLLFPAEHPYSLPFTGSGTTTSIGKLDRDDLVAWHRTWFAPGSMTLVATGDLTLAELEREAKRVFADWPAATAPSKQVTLAANATPTTPAKRPIYLVDRPDATQSVIVAAHLTHPGGHVQDLAIDTVMRLFGGMATSRLNRNLRLDKHWSYGTQGSLWDARGPRPFVVVAPVQTDKTKESMLEVAKEIAGVAGARPIVGEEYSSIMRSSVLRMPGRFETLAALEEAAIDLVAFGYPDSWWADYATKVRGLSEADLASAAAVFVRPQDVVWLVVGDRRKIEAGIRELAWGDLMLLDADGHPVEEQTAIVADSP